MSSRLAAHCPTFNDECTSWQKGVKHRTISSGPGFMPWVKRPKQYVFSHLPLPTHIPVIHDLCLLHSCTPVTRSFLKQFPVPSNFLPDHLFSFTIFASLSKVSVLGSKVPFQIAFLEHNLFHDIKHTRLIPTSIKKNFSPVHSVKKTALIL